MCCKKCRTLVCAVMLVLSFSASGSAFVPADDGADSEFVPEPSLSCIWFIALPVVSAAAAAAEYLGICTSEDTRAAVEYVEKKCVEDSPSFFERLIVY